MQLVSDKHAVVESDQRQLVTMRVNDQLVGLHIKLVHDVFAAQRITPVPRAASSVLGLVNLRGRVVTLLSLRSLLGYPVRPFEDGMMAVGVEWKEEAFGLVIDEIGDVITVDAADRDSSAGKVEAGLAAMAVAIHKLPQGLIVELGVDALLASPIAKAA